MIRIKLVSATSSIFVLLMLLASVSCKTLEQKSMSLEDQLADIMAIWPGTFSNDQQIEEVSDAGKDVWRIDDSGEGGYLNLKSHYIKLNRPDIADHVLYVEEYRDNQPSETYRQRIYTLSVDAENGFVRVKMWPFKDKEKYIGAWRDLSLLAGMTSEELTAFPDVCDLIVQRKDDRYHMYMHEQDCNFGEKVFNYEVMLSRDVFSYRDKITQKSDGATISTAANFAYHDLDRIN